MQDDPQPVANPPTPAVPVLRRPTRLTRIWEALPAVLRKSLVDYLLLIALMLCAFFCLRTTPEFAANLPQDAGDFAAPAVNLIEKSQLSVNWFGGTIPPSHQLGLPLLLVPSYLIFGHFLGNGIYTILCCALLSVVAVYWIGRQLAGRICGCLAALFLISHHGFHQFAQKIMSEVPSMMLMALALGLLLYLRNRKLTYLGYISVGVLAGTAFAIRVENALIFLPIFAVLVAGTPHQWVRRTVGVAVGVTPWLLALLMFNKVHHGSAVRTGFHDYHHFKSALSVSDALPLFSSRYLTARGYIQAHGYSNINTQAWDGNPLALAESTLSQVDNTSSFAHPSKWGNKPKRIYETAIGLRSILGFVGLFWCFFQWRRNPSAKLMGVWFVVLFLSLFGFFAFFWWQEERYLLRLVPFLCVLNGIGPAVLLNSLQRRQSAIYTEAVFCTTTAVLALIGFLAYYSLTQQVPQSDDNLVLYESMRRAGEVMESNAVVVTNWDPVRPDAYIIRGTQRKLLPLIDYDDHAPFVVAKSPDKLLSLMLSGRPAYLLLRNPFDWQLPPPEFQSLQACGFRFEPIITVTLPDGRPIGAYVYRVRFDSLPFVISP